MGSVTAVYFSKKLMMSISTHTLRGERDNIGTDSEMVSIAFQLTRSVGSVTLYDETDDKTVKNFNSHAPWGA